MNTLQTAQSGSLHPLVLPRQRSPLGSLIGQPTCYKSKRPPPGKIRIYCHTCKRWKCIDKDSSDPPNAAIIDVTCPDCNPSDRTLVDYFDEEGRQIDCDGNLMSRENK